jgi:hypothetical protein
MNVSGKGFIFCKKFFERGEYFRKGVLYSVQLSSDLTMWCVAWGKLTAYTIASQDEKGVHTPHVGCGHQGFVRLTM